MVRLRRGSMTVLPAFVVTCLIIPTPDAIARPDDGDGLFVYDESDVLAAWDVPEARVRVHYSIEGPNRTILDDDDDDGVPDFVSLVGQEVAEVEVFFQMEGFRAPLHESDVGLGPLGGSDAIDVYLVDFGGASDGQFAVDGCVRDTCAGHLLIENDFAGYGYRSLRVAARVLASHELFHAVQFAYTSELDSWFSEGTATWAEHLYQPEVADYLNFCAAYLADISRSIDRPPAGAITAFSYGTALYFGFVQEMLGVATMVDMMERLGESEDVDEVTAMLDAVAFAGGDFSELWVTFMRWNLATGARAGLTESYPYATELRPGISAEVSGTAIVDDNRFYPLAATFFQLDHGGGELLVGVGEDNLEEVVFQVFPTSSAGKVRDSILWWQPLEQSVHSLGVQDAGTYWLMGTYPEVAPESAPRLLCFGGSEAMTDCLPEHSDGAGDTGLWEDSGGGDDDGAASTDGSGQGGDAKSGCMTIHQSVVGWALWVPVLGLIRRRV